MGLTLLNDIPPDALIVPASMSAEVWCYMLSAVVQGASLIAICAYSLRL